MLRSLLAGVMAAVAASAEAADVARGEYLFHAAGCAACHTDVAGKGPPLAGGRKLKTAFGTFVSPNITPDPDHGIGRWSDGDFIRALRDGVAPDGRHYFPVFPYPSFTRMRDDDMRDLKAYIFSLPPVAKTPPPHEVGAPFGWRFLVGFWKGLFFSPGAFQPTPARDAVWNRGAYIVEALAHCGECHTPRNALGAKQADMALAGTAQGPEGGRIPNITPDPETGIGKWSDSELRSLFKDGMLPDGDFIGSTMGEVVANTTSKLTDADVGAALSYLRSVPAIRNKVESKK